jgi:molecular chaperone GrpE
MTSVRKPAGAPDEERPPAGSPADPRPAAGAKPAKSADEHSSDEDRPVRDRIAPGVGDEEAARVDSDLDELLAETQRERDEYLEIAQRARADFENYRKRAAREAHEAERRGKLALARELVPALDNLERALRAAGIDPEPGTAGGGHGEAPSEEVSAHEALAGGVALVYGELRAALERAGVEAYDPTGQRFDPTEHEALSVRSGEDGVDAGVVIETLEKGYRLDGRVLRAARVVVSE